MARRIVENDAGQQLELVQGRWVPITGAGEGTGIGDAVLIGAGRQLTRMGRGAQNLVAAALGNQGWQDELRARDAEEARYYGELSRAHPVATFAGEMLPDVAMMGLGLTGAAARKVGSLAAEQAALGALSSGTVYQAGGVGDQLVGAVLGAAAGGAGTFAGESLGRVVAARSAMAARQQQLLEAITRGQQAQAAQAAQAVVPQQVQVAVTRGAQPTVAEQAARAAGVAEGMAEEVAPGAQARAAAGAAGGADRVAQADPRLEADRLMARADQLGVHLTAGQVLDNPSLRQVEASIGSFPLTSAAEQMRKAGNRKRVNQIFGKAAGLGDAMDEITPASLGGALNELDAEFKTIAQQIGDVRSDGEFVRELGLIEARNATDPFRTDKLEPVLARMTELFQEGGGQIPGRDLMQWRSSATRAMSDAAQRGEGQLSARLREVIGALDDMVVRQGGEELGGRYAKARARYRLVDALLEPGVVKNGNVMPGRAHTVIQRRYPAEFARGNQYGQGLAPELEDAFDVLRIAGRYGDIVGDSGTATRMSLQTLLSDPAGSLTGNVVAALAQGAVGRAGGALASPVGQAGAAALVAPAATRAPLYGGLLGRLIAGEAWREGTE